MGCDTCKARNRCETYIQPGSIMCVIYQMQEGGTKGGTRPKATDILPLLRETAENHWHRTLLRQYEVLERIQANGEISMGKT